MVRRRFSSDLHSSPYAKIWVSLILKLDFFNDLVINFYWHSVILDVITSADPDYSEEKLFMMNTNNVALTCDLTSTTHELPVLWFKDGLLVSTITSGKCNECFGNDFLFLNYFYILTC